MRRINRKSAVDIRQNLAILVAKQDIAIGILPISTLHGIPEPSRTSPESKRRPVCTGFVPVLADPFQGILHLGRRQAIPERIEIHVQGILVVKALRLNLPLQKIARRHIEVVIQRAHGGRPAVPADRDAAFPAQCRRYLRIRFPIRFESCPVIVVIPYHNQRRCDARSSYVAMRLGISGHDVGRASVQFQFIQLACGFPLTRMPVFHTS